MPQGDPLGYNFMAAPGGQAMQRGQQRDKYRGQLDDLQRQMGSAQLQGGNPMQLMNLQADYNNAQQGFQDWQNQQYSQQMGQWNQPGAGTVGGGPGNRSQLQMNPYLVMLLQNSLGMAGPGGGGGYGPQMG